MTKYIVWEFQDFELMDEFYESVTGEALQLMPMMNEEKTHMMIGSSRVTPQAFDELVLYVPSVDIMDSWPDWWVEHEDEFPW